jgi:hypothetical protein
VKLEVLKDSRKKFQEIFKGLAALIETMRDKIFPAISNLYFFDLLRGIQVDFNVTFYPFLNHDFTYVFSLKVISA